MRPQRPGAIGLAVAVPVDVEAVARRVVEVVVVRPLGRRLQRDDVRDHRHRPGLLGAREQIEVGEVCGRVVRDQRSLAVARGHRLARPAGRERSCAQHKRSSAGRNARRNGGTHTHRGVPPCSDTCRRAPPASCRAVFGECRASRFGLGTPMGSASGHAPPSGLLSTRAAGRPLPLRRRGGRARACGGERRRRRRLRAAARLDRDGRPCAYAPDVVEDHDGARCARTSAAAPGLPPPARQAPGLVGAAGRRGAAAS